jgi:hypothetical protein
MHTSSIHLPSGHAASALCPVCGGSEIRISTSIEVHYDVVFEATARDFLVVDEVLGDAMWDAETPAACPHCDWRGTVGDLRRTREALPGYAS